MLNEIKGLFTHWRLLLSMVSKDMTIRYKGSMLGIFWSLVTPLFLMAVYSFVFGVLYSKFEMENYHIYLLTGLLPWVFLSTALNNSVMSFVTNSSLITKVYFPRCLVPVSACLSQAVHFVLSLIPLALFMIFARMDFSARLLWLPVILAIQLAMVAGIAMLISTAYVFFRDIQHLMEPLLLAWFFLSPIIYPVKMIENQPAIWTFLKWNPMNPFLELYHRVLYYPSYEAVPLRPESFLAAAGFALGFFVLGLVVLHRNEAEMVKVL
jgi:ABC-2 type transport system permease protein